MCQEGSNVEDRQLLLLDFLLVLHIDLNVPQQMTEICVDVDLIVSGSLDASPAGTLVVAKVLQDRF